ncbi:MAG: asparagine synthase (glutamine-hydrolyzing) [Rickettsiales bacterium]
MCGFTGWAISSEKALSTDILQRMNNAISHRGPDGSGIFQTQTRNNRFSIALSHRRLAIIDLVTGEQPMHSPDGTISLVFNGEIYNFMELRDELKALGHIFRTTSDTEVLLEAYRAWGVDCVKRFRGMFAFALWDAAEEELFIARDRFGKKPLFLWQQQDNLIFGSEIKSLLANPMVSREMDLASVQNYLQYRYVPGPHTLFKNITKLEPGSYAVFKSGSLRIMNYYLPPDADRTPGKDPGNAEALSGFMDKLDECVRLRMISDVPFGAFLSGGLDSSAIVALMCRHSSLPINTFSLGFKEAQFSELNYARMVADHFKTNHHELVMVAEDIMTLLPETIGYNDGPMAEPTDIGVFALAREAGKTVKMVLSGEGSDEMLAGYPKHKFEPYAALYQSIVPATLHDYVVEPLANLLPHSFYRVRTLVESMGLRDPKERLPRWFGALNLKERNALSAISIPPRAVSDRAFTTEQRAALRRVLFFDQASWLPDNLLERGDRMTMAASIEGRMPFMDHELTHFITRLPDSYRIRGGTQKWLLRESMKPILPAEILTRRKVGFRVPVSRWFRTTLKDYVYDHLLGSDSLTQSFYNKQVLGRYLDEHVNGRKNHEKLIWILLNLELFQRQYKLSF